MLCSCKRPLLFENCSLPSSLAAEEELIRDVKFTTGDAQA